MVHANNEGVDQSARDDERGAAAGSVRLDNVARIIERVLTTIDNNPDILKHLTQPVGEAAEEVGAGAGQAVDELETGAGSAVEDVGQAVDDVGEKAPRQRASEGEQAQQPTERASGGRRRRRTADSPEGRPARGSRTSRAPRPGDG